MILTRRAVLPVTSASLALLLVGCVDPNSGEGGVEEVHSMLSTTNGLATVNGLSTHNGLTSNGLNTVNGLATVNGLSSTTGLMTTDAGRATVGYLVRCALAAGVTITKRDQNGTTYSYSGELGLAPQWQTGSCDTDCQETISACMLAHINTAGVHIPLWVVAQDPSVGWSLSPAYPNQEGSFFGNIFLPGAHGVPSNQMAAYYCDGIAYNKDVVPGRIGANQVGAPYTDPFTKTGYCTDGCTAADKPYASSGFKACNGWNHVMTVWRQAGN
jgi:hypothetical protein